MDLVHIGYKIDATGIQEANKQVDALLSKTDKLNRTNVKVGGTGFSQTTKSVKDTSSSLDRMIERQKTLSSLLPYMDKSMANLSSTFWMASKEVNSFNKYLDVLDNKKAILDQKKQAEALAQAQAKAAETARLAEQKANTERVRALQLEQAKTKYIQQGFSTTSAGQLASLEIGGASISDIQKRAALS